MSQYRRAKIKGGAFFFTVTLADRSSDLLVRHIDHLREVYASVGQRQEIRVSFGEHKASVLRAVGKGA
jgi:putative transposase